jgi:hypothetical protein
MKIFIGISLSLKQVSRNCQNSEICGSRMILKNDRIGAVHRFGDDTLYEAVTWNTKREIEEKINDNVRWLELSEECVRFPLVSASVLKPLHNT